MADGSPPLPHFHDKGWQGDAHPGHTLFYCQPGGYLPEPPQNVGLTFSPLTSEETEVQRGRAIGWGAVLRETWGRDLNLLGNEPLRRMGGSELVVWGAVIKGKWGQSGWALTGARAAQGNKGTNLDGLRLQFEAVEGVDGFVCVVGIRVVHKPIAQALPCGQDQDNDLLPGPASVLPDPNLRGWPPLGHLRP